MKTAFITGASSGFGKATAIKLLENGYKVIALARRKQRLDELVQKYKDKVYIICVDIQDKNALFDAIDKIPDDFKDISVLVNNAGLALGLDEFDKTDINDFETMVDTNIKGLLYVTHKILPILRKTAKKSSFGAYIFNLGSVAETNAYFGGNVYAGTKAFVGQFSQSLRNDVRGENIKVTDIAPGLCKTEFSEVRFKGDKQKADKVYEGTKYLSGDDIAEAIFAMLNLPPHVNINKIELMPVTQTWAGFYTEKI